MKYPGKTVRRKYHSIRYCGEPVECLYCYDAKVDRWVLISSNVPGLIMEHDSIKDLEIELPEVIEMLEPGENDGDESASIIVPRNMYSRITETAVLRVAGVQSAEAPWDVF